MDINILKEFTYLSHDLSFTQAAKRCYISQSNLSRHIQALEQELGQKLFIRDKMGVRLTPCGEAFAVSAKQIVDIYNDAIKRLQDLRQNFTDVLRISYIPSTTKEFIERAYELQLQRFPDVKVELFSSWEERALMLLKQDKVDIAIVMVFDELDPDTFSSLKIYDDRYNVLLSESSPLRESDDLSLGDLSDQLVLIPSKRDNSAQYEHLSKALDDFPDIEYQDVIDDEYDNAALTNAGKGVAVVRERQLSGLRLGTAKAVRLTDASLDYSVCAIWKKDNETPVVQGFVQVLEDMLRESAEDDAERS